MTDAPFKCDFKNTDSSAILEILIGLILDLNILQMVPTQNIHQHLSTLL